MGGAAQPRAAAWPEPEFRGVFVKFASILSAAKRAKYGLFSEEYRATSRRWRCFDENTRAKSGFTKNFVVIYT
jgi:hypothetical protein